MNYYKTAESLEQQRAETDVKRWFGALSALRDEARLLRDTRERWQRHQASDGQLNSQIGYVLDAVAMVLEQAEGRGYE